MVTVSLCMIVKNEEKVLARCLDSIRAAVDEIIIVDTGSTDRTKEIAAQYTEKIFDFMWDDDFAAARNYSFSKATMEFAMWLDADDVFTEKDLLQFLRLKESAWENADTVMMRYNTAFDEEGQPVFSYYRERLIRLSVPHTWKGRVHEAIACSGRVVYAEDVAVTHRSVKTAYSDRNLHIYERQIREGEALTLRDQFYYGRELYYHKKYEHARQVLEKFLSDRSGWVENKIEACKILAYCCLETGGPEDAFRALTRSFLYDLPRAEICCEIGGLLMRLENWRAAVFWFELARALPQNAANGGFLSADCHGYLPCIQLCVCYYRLGEIQKAAEYNRLAGTYRPLSPAYIYNLKFFSEYRQNTP